MIGALLTGATGSLDPTVRKVALVVTVLMFLIVIDLVRRRRLVERYALLWMVGAAALLALAAFPSLLDFLAKQVGIAAPANGLFLLSIGIIFVLLLHFSVAVSRLGEEVKVLAQEAARLDQELRAERAARTGEAFPAEPDTEEQSFPAAPLS